jgi:uncharacterized protein (DUF1501 family)
MTVVRRRDFVQMMAACGVLGSAGVTLPRLAFADAPGEGRLVVWFLLGGLDGLSAVPAHGDPDYRRMRKGLALAPPGEPGGIVDLDGFFGLHPCFRSLEPLYRRGELLPVHAIATSYRLRSHFEAMKILENGTDTPPEAPDGWLNRALQYYGEHGGRRAFSIKGSPMGLQGDLMVGDFDDDGMEVADSLLDLAQELYGDDRLFGPALQEGRRLHAFAKPIVPPGANALGSPAADPNALPLVSALAGAFLAQEAGPRICAFNVGNYDSHGFQDGEGGLLPATLPPIAAAILALEKALGPHWRNTVVVAVTEFGRAVVPNGDNGTDHGTAGAALLAGGALKGGRVLADWPGLKPDRLLDARDLMPTRDLRSLFKGLLRDHLHLPEGFIEDRVFPASSQHRPIDDLIRPSPT